jgi:hypothetical protein
VKQNKESEQARVLVEGDDFLFINIGFFNGNEFSKMIAQ